MAARNLPSVLVETTCNLQWEELIKCFLCMWYHISSHTLSTYPFRKLFSNTTMRMQYTHTAPWSLEMSLAHYIMPRVVTNQVQLYLVNNGSSIHLRPVLLAWHIHWTGVSNQVNESIFDATTSMGPVRYVQLCCKWIFESSCLHGTSITLRTLVRTRWKRSSIFRFTTGPASNQMKYSTSNQWF